MSENKEKSAWSAKNPYMSKITECYVLNGKGSRKETRHVVFDLGDSGLDYKVGDALGVLSENPEETVNLLIETAGWDESQIVSTRSGEVTLREALNKDFEIHRVNKKFVNSLSEKVTFCNFRHVWVFCTPCRFFFIFRHVGDILLARVSKHPHSL